MRAAATPGRASARERGWHFELRVPVSRREALALASSAARLREEATVDLLDTFGQRARHLAQELAVAIARAEQHSAEARQLRLAQEFLPLIEEFLEHGHLPVRLVQRMQDAARRGMEAIGQA
ncbi:MAG: hypothetical protein HKL99_14250 [Burkholderiales bacterium]|nr:hypothetical protein [Burkholderiales bacterium]